MSELLHRTQIIGLVGSMLIGCVVGCSDDRESTNNGGPASQAIKQSASEPLASATNTQTAARQQIPNPVGRITRVQNLEKQLQGDPETRESILSELRALAEDADIRVREAAAKALATAGECSEESLDLLLDGLRRPIGGNAFAVPLNKLGEPAIPGVLKALQSDEATTRKNAAFCLGLTWSVADAEARIAALSDLVEHDTDPIVRHQAAVSIAILARHDEVDPKLKVLVIPTLTKALEDASNTTDNRRHLAAVIGDMGHKAHPLIPTMVSLLQDEDAEMRADAADALGMLASPYQIKRGRVVLDADMPDYRADSDSTNMAVEALISALSDPNSEVRGKAAVGLSHIGRAGADAAAALTQQLQEEETEPRLRAAEALVRIAADPSAAIPVLEAAAAGNTTGNRARWWKARAQQLLQDINSSTADNGHSE